MTLVIAIILAVQFSLSWVWWVVIIAAWLAKQALTYNTHVISLEQGINLVLESNDEVKKLIKSIKLKKD